MTAAMTVEPSTPLDLSVVLNVHDNAINLWRTLRSTEEAARYARHEGISVELVVVLDRPTPQIVELVDQLDPSAFDAYQTVLVDHGSLGPSRNAGVEAARGTYVSACDSDDLISFNGFVATLDAAQRRERVVVVPEYLFVFGDVHGISRYSDSDSVTALQMIGSNQYTSRITASRELLREVPYADVPLGRGYAFEDWHHNCELLAAGASFVIARDTILFYRRHNRSLSTSWQMSTQQIPASRLFDPAAFLRCTDSEARPVERIESGVAAASQLEREVGFVRSARCRELVHAANCIDPAIRMTRYESAPWVHLRSHPSLVGATYRRFCEAVGPDGGCFSDVVLASASVGRDGAEQICRVLHALRELDPRARTLVLTEDQGDLAPWRDLLPPDSLAWAIRDSHQEIAIHEIDLIALKAIQATAVGARIHLGRSAFGARFWRSFGALFSENSSVLHRLGAQSEVIDQRTYSVDEDVDLISTCLDTIDVVLAASSDLRDVDRRRFRTDEHKWHVLDMTGEITSPITMMSELERIFNGHGR
jgi:hypothetical protein